MHNDVHVKGSVSQYIWHSLGGLSSGVGTGWAVGRQKRDPPGGAAFPRVLSLVEGAFSRNLVVIAELVKTQVREDAIASMIGRGFAFRSTITFHQSALLLYAVLICLINIPQTLFLRDSGIVQMFFMPQ